MRRIPAPFHAPAHVVTVLGADGVDVVSRLQRRFSDLRIGFAPMVRSRRHGRRECVEDGQPAGSALFTWSTNDHVIVQLRQECGDHPGEGRIRLDFHRIVDEATTETTMIELVDTLGPWPAMFGDLHMSDPRFVRTMLLTAEATMAANLRSPASDPPEDLRLAMRGIGHEEHARRGLAPETPMRIYSPLPWAVAATAVDGDRSSMEPVRNHPLPTVSRTFVMAGTTEHYSTTIGTYSEVVLPASTTPIERLRCAAALAEMRRTAADA